MRGMSFMTFGSQQVTAVSTQSLAEKTLTFACRQIEGDSFL
jgi:hypothetical protein